jgi:peptidoglycan/xylan/chitin deacetylase (PgdA/CDA1 family)
LRLASVSVDLDEIPNYFEIHGLRPPEGPAASLVYDVAIGRLRALADAGGFPLTLFAIGSDLARAGARRALREAAEDEHEIANHTLDHRYDLVRLGREEITRQVDEGARVIADAVGARPVGFRAPGYTITDEVFDVLEGLDVAYDSSVFPCPAYFAAKTAAIGAIAARGRTSRSIVDTPKVLLAPTRPYRIGKPYWRRGDGLLEIPVQVTRGLRLPFIGTSVTLAGPSNARRLARMCVGEPLVNLELHGIDVLDASDGLEALRPHQHDVRVAHARKLESLLAATTELRNAGYAFVTMREAAKALS